jgi:hypothetical protein
MTNFEACAVLYQIKQKLEQSIAYRAQQNAKLKLKEDSDEIRWWRERDEEAKREIAALDKAGAALTKRS